MIYDFPFLNHKHKHWKSQTQKFQIYDFPFQNHKHKHKQLTWLRRNEPRKKRKEKDRERGGPMETHGGSEVAGLRQWGVGTNGAVVGSGDAGMRVRVTKGKSVWGWRRGAAGMRLKLEWVRIREVRVRVRL